MGTIKFLVIGSNSFSGSHFVNGVLKAGLPVIGISRSKEPDSVFVPYLWNIDLEKYPLFNLSNYSFLQADLNLDLEKIMDFIDEEKPTHVVNFASQGMVAESWKNPVDWYQTNVLSQVAFHDELRKRTYLEKYIHISTPEVYGSTDEGWITEDHRFRPSTPYAVSRASCEMHLNSFFKAYNFPLITTRAANVYGPGQQLYRIIPKTILCARTDKKLPLHGSGKSIRSFIHIEDVVEATIELSLKGQVGTSWHISTNRKTSIKSLVESICKIMQVEFAEVVQTTEERLGKDQNYLLDSRKIRNAHKWSDSIELEDGLLETIKWVDNNIDKLVKLPWDYIHKA